MKKILKSINVPIPYVIMMSIGIIVLASLGIQGSISVGGVVGVTALAIIIASSIYYGRVILVYAVSSFISLLMVSIYTTTVSDFNGMISQPFFLSLALISIFLAQSYSGTKNFDLRNRFLWASIMAVIVISIKTSLIISGFNFWTAEVIGLNAAIIYIATWRLWINNSKKTKLNKPDVIKRVDKNSFRYVYIDDKMDEVNNKWVTKDGLNSYPWVYNEVISAYEDDLILIIKSNYSNSKIYDLGEIHINNAKTIPYLYMESTEESNTNEIVSEFINDITKAEYHTKDGNIIV